MSRTKDGKKKFSFFWLFYVVMIIALIIFWFKVNQYVKDCLIRYEAAQPDKVVQQIVADLQTRGFEQYMKYDQEVSRFEETADYEEEFRSRWEGKNLTYQINAERYDTTSPAYTLYADGEAVANIDLKVVSSEPMMIILSLEEWALNDVELLWPQGGYSLDVQVPDAFKVVINGMEASTSELIEEAWDMPQFQYSSEYVAVPQLIGYHAEGMLKEPTIEIFDNQDNEIVCDRIVTDKNTTIKVDTFEQGIAGEEIQEMALKNAKTYSNYFSTDLEGCRQSTKPIRGLFPEGSYYLDLAETYRQEDMWMYADHDAPVFSEEVVSNYYPYTEDLFSIEVSFKKSMRLKGTGGVKSDITHMCFYYGRIEDEWKILDIQTILSEEVQ